MKFTKMHGAGNDFIIINNIEEQLPLKCFGELAKKLCHRRLSIGADGLMVVERATLQSKCGESTKSEKQTANCNDAEASDELNPSCDFRMIFYNADGSEGEMCGNGARCIARYGYEHGLAGNVQRIETISGIVEGQRLSEKLYRVKLNPVSRMEVDYLSHPIVRGEPSSIKEFVTSDLSCTEACANKAQEMLKVSYVELGTPGLPHAVVELKGVKSIVESLRASGADVSAVDICTNDASAEGDITTELKNLGKALRYHEVFPRGANVNFYEICEGGTLHGKTGNEFSEEVYVLTYERGVEDFTLACGTGVSSTVAVLTKQHRVEGSVADIKQCAGVGADQVDNVSYKGVRVHVVGGELAVDVEGEHLYLTGEAEIVAEGEILHI